MSDNLDKQSSGDFWEARWRADDTPWDHGRPAPPFEEFVEREGAPQGRILIPGPGSGHDVRYFAQLGAEVTGLDISPSAVQAARQRNPHARATYEEGNILQPDDCRFGQFDWIIEHTCLCALDPVHWPAYAESIPKLLTPGGFYLAIFYRNPDTDAGPPFRIEADEIDALFGSAFKLLQAWNPRLSFESRAGREEVRLYQAI